MLVDTHAHLWFDDYLNDLDQVIERAKIIGVEKIISLGITIESNIKNVALAKKYEGQVFAGVGIHPEETVTENFYFEIAELENIIVENRDHIVAVGEIGIDLFTDEVKQTLSAQKELFKAQVELAIKYDLPVIIHTRNSFDEAWEVLSSLPQMPRGQFHCFSVEEEALKKVLGAGFYVSFAGNITWSKRVAKMVPLVPSDRLLLETDSPLMVPRDAKGLPIKGTERNEPMNVAYLAQWIADLRGEKMSEVEEYTTANVKTLYKL